MTAPSSVAERAYALLRIVAGFLFLCHGMQKMFGILGGTEPEFGTQMWIGGFLELVCGLAICVGFLTSIAAFVASGMMAVAYFQFHWKFQSDENFLPLVNQGELAVLYCFLFLYVATRGSGPWALGLRRRK
jgi:putative oxidoreductase